MAPLPSAAKDQAYIDVSVLRAGLLEIPREWAIDIALPGERLKSPTLSFLLHHSKTRDTFVFDLGVRRDWQNATPAVVGIVKHMQFEIEVPQDVVESLAAGNLSPDDIKHVCISHLHLDHFGNPAYFTKSIFVVGEGCRELLSDHVYPKDPTSAIPSDPLPLDRTTFLDLSSSPPIGPFEHALDFYGDGSLYIVDAGPAHIPGHINILARTSPDGGWVYLAGDTAHDRQLLYGEGKIPRHSVFGCAHLDPEKAAEHIAKVRQLMEEESRVQVILAHDKPWYDENTDRNVWFPSGKITSL